MDASLSHPVISTLVGTVLGSICNEYIYQQLWFQEYLGRHGYQGLLAVKCARREELSLGVLFGRPQRVKSAEIQGKHLVLQYDLGPSGRVGSKRG